MAWTLDDLRGLTLARQFPAGPPAPADPAGPADLLRRIGPIQSQTARSPFLALAARAPGTAYSAIVAAYESSALLRGSTIRGTVHTVAADQHVLLDGLTRVGQRRLWERSLPLDRLSLEDVWTALERFAGDRWRTPDELGSELRRLLAARQEHPAIARLDNQAGRYLCFGHGGLVRRPLSGGWDGQGRAGYRQASALIARPVTPPPTAVRNGIRLHLAAHGPATRKDIAWWSGLTLGVVDAALAELDAEVVWRDGTDGAAYADLAEAPAPIDMAGVRLLPEFDSLLCAYDPHGRERFITTDRHARLWNRGNGLMRPPVLLDGVISGHWAMSGTGRRRRIEVTWFAGCRGVRPAELDGSVEAIGAALEVSITEVAQRDER